MTTPTKRAPRPPKLGEEQLGLFLYQMMLIRRFEEKCGELYTKGKIRGFLHLYTGQEACAVGAIAALEDRDKIVTHYRDHGHALRRRFRGWRLAGHGQGRHHLLARADDCPRRGRV